MIFQIGDKAAYPARGIVEIAGIEQRDVDGNSLSFYVLRALTTDDKVLVPIDNAETRGLRPLCDADAARALIDVLDTPGTLSAKEPPNRRHRSLKERLERCTALETATVYRDLQRLREQKPLSFGEVRLLDTARQRLAIELALAFERDVDEMSQELDSHFPIAA